MLRLHSVEINKEAYVKGLYLSHINFAKYNVEVQLLRRPNMLEDIAPRPDILIAEGDVIVLLGSSEALSSIETYLLTGK